MNYNEWLELLDILTKSSDNNYIEKVLNEPLNPNLIDKIKPKIINMIHERLAYLVKNITINLDEIFNDKYMLDIELVNFRKSIIQTLNLINNNYLTEAEKRNLITKLNEDIDKVYTILEKEALISDETGELLSIVKNNRIKRNDENEL